MFRTLAALIERRGDVTHAFGALDNWHFLTTLGRRPLVYTAVVPSAGPDLDLWRRISTIVVESDRDARSVIHAGVAPSRVRLVYPGIDLNRFVPSPPPTGRFRLLFASSPASVSEFEPRGIHLLVELARRHRDVDVVVLWRRWGNEHEAMHALRALRPPGNFSIEYLGDREMPDVYARAHAVVCLFGDGFGKSCPNSIVEALACGRPVLVSETCGLAGLVEQSGAGLTTSRAVSDVSTRLTELRDRYRNFNARDTATAHFDVRRFREAYDAIYDDAMHDTRAVDADAIVAASEATTRGA